MNTLLIAKVTVLFVLGVLILRAMRRSSSAARHLVIVLTFVSALLLPALAMITPQWQVIPAVTIMPVAKTGARSLVLPSEIVQKPHDVLNNGFINTTNNALIRSLSLWHVWATGAWTLLLVLLVRIAAMHRIVQRAKPLHDHSWTWLRNQLCQEFGMNSHVQLKRRSTNTMPAVWGIMNPVVLLPADCQNWSPARRRAVMKHEFAHIQRRDVVSIIFSHIVCAVYWFHPLAWMLKQKMECESEQACDDLAIATGNCASTYADHLLNTAVAYHQRRSLAPVMAARSQMEGRIMAILDTDRCRKGITKRVTLSIALLAITAIVPLSCMARVQADDPVRAHMTSASDSAEFARHLLTLDTRQDRVGALLAFLDSSDALTRAAAAWALAEYDEPQVIDALIRAGDDRDATVRQWAIRSLSDDKNSSIAAMLQSRLEDPDVEVREWAARSLGHYDNADSQRAIADRFAVETNGQVSEWLIRSINNAKDSASLNALITALNNQHADVRQWAARGLDQVRDERAVDALIDTLSDRNDEVREWSARSLAMCGNERAIAPLQALVQDPDADVREWARFALDKIKC